MASVRRNTVTSRSASKDVENLGMTSSVPGKRRPSHVNQEPARLSRKPLTSQSGTKSSNARAASHPPPKKYPGQSKDQNSKTKDVNIRASQDKENQSNKRQSEKTNSRKDGVMTKSALRTKSATSVATTKQAPSSSRSVSFTPAPTKSTVADRGNGLNSLRRSLRESVTPPNQKQKLAPNQSAPPTLLQTPSSHPNQQGSPNETESLQHSENMTPSMTAVQLVTNQPPKTPKSMLKEQLDLSLDESMLLSPGAQNNSYQVPHQPLKACEERGEEAGLEEAHPSHVKGVGATCNELPKVTSESIRESVVETNKTTATSTCAKPSSMQAKGGVFSASRQNARSVLKNRMQPNKLSRVACAPMTTTPVPPMDKAEIENSAHLQAKLPYETPYAVQDIKHGVAATVVGTNNETPYNKRGNGVCMDLTAMFFNEQKTVRKCNKREVGSQCHGGAQILPAEDSALMTDATTTVPSDDEWAEMQCVTFSKWLNFTLQPNADYEDLEESQSNNENEVAQPQSPSALRALVLHQRMARSRVAATQLYGSEDMQNIRNIIRTEVAKGKLAIRADRDMYSDLTLRKKIVSLLLCYSTPWLRVGLETLFGESILPEVPTQFSPVKRTTHESRKTPTHQLRVAIRDFIVHRVLSDANVLAKYTKGRCKVPSGNFEKRYRAEMRSLVLSRLLELFFFLDRAKRSNILDKSPRLFAKSAQVKSSRDVLISFCRDFLASEGDITKHLSRVGLKVSFKQDPIDEIELGITNFAVDLRDGIRLTKTAEIFLGAEPKSLLATLRIPAVSRLQKLHNVRVALGALRNLMSVPEDIAAHHIVDGHRAMVLKLMWTIIVFYCFPAVLDFEKIKREIENIRRKLQERPSESQLSSVATFPGGTDGDTDIQDKGKALLLQWCQAVCALFNLHIYDFSESFADGRALCLLVHYYHPNMLTLSEIRRTTKEKQSTNPHSLDQLRYNERANSALAHRRMSELGGIPNMMPTADTSAVPDEKSMIVYLCYAFSRLLTSRNEVQACLVIQNRYREYRSCIRLASQTRAAIKICGYWASNRENYYRNQKLHFAEPVAKIERFILMRWGSLKRLQLGRMERELESSASIFIQNQCRSFLARKRVFVLSKQYKVAINMQRSFRRYRAMKAYKKLTETYYAALRIQCLWRGFKARQAIFLTVSSIVFIQAFARGELLRRRVKSVRQASICIQKCWRGFWDQLQYQIVLLDIIAVQSLVRRKSATRLRVKKSHAVMILQLAARFYIARCKLHRRQEAARALMTAHGMATAIQRIVRAFLARRKASQRRIGFLNAVTIQRKWRAKVEHIHSMRRTLAAARIQSLYRAVTAQQEYRACRFIARTVQVLWKRRQARFYLQHIIQVQSIARRWCLRKAIGVRKRAVSLIQHASRRYLAIKHVQILRTERYFFVSTVVFCQSIIRWHLTKKRYALFHKKTVSLQALFRGKSARKGLQSMHKSATLIQSHVRRHFCEEMLLKTIAAATTLENFWRSRMEQIFYQRLLSSTVRIQAKMRGQLARNVPTRRAAMARILTHGAHLRVQSCGAAQLIQSWWRVQHGQKSLRQKNEKCAVLIQSSFRRKIALSGLKHKLKAATSIQALWRAYSIMRNCQETMGNVIKIQALFRGYLSRCIAYKRLQLKVTMRSLQVQSRALRDSATVSSRVIQSRWRCYRQKAKYRRVQRRILCLQAIIRGFSIRTHHKHVIRQVIKIQSYIRRNQQLHQYAQLRQAVCILQQRFRALRAKKEAHLVQRKIVLLQALVRRNQALGRFRKCQRCTVLWQSRYRGYCARRELAKLHDNAVLIQNAWRGFISVVGYQMNLIAIIVGQSHIRRWLAERRSSRRLNATVRLQSAARMWSSKDHTVELRLKQREIQKLNSGAVLIQKVFRGGFARQRTVRERAARDIQKCWRCYTVHVDFLISVLSVLAIQSLGRRYLARCQFSSKIAATVMIQSHFRRFCAWRTAQERLSRITRIQAYMRMRLVYRGLEKEHKATAVIQRNWRLALVKNRLNLEHIAAMDIQRIWRGYVDTFNFNLIVFATLQVQHAVRGFLAKRAKRRLEDEKQRERMPLAAITIQSAIRNFLSKFAFRRIRRQIISVQAVFRGRRVRNRRDRRAKLMQVTVARLTEANLRATNSPNMKLGARTIAALTVLQTSSRLAEIMTAICTLELSTRFSRACCESFAHAKATDILLSLIRQCNRSLPHVELLSYIMLTLKNVARYDCFLTYVATVNCAEIFLDLVQMFRDKDGIFCISVSLLERCIKYDEEIKDLCRSHENMKRLKSVYALTSKKLSSVGTRRSSMKTPSSDSRKYIPGVLRLGAPDVKAGLHSLKSTIAYIEGK